MNLGKCPNCMRPGELADPDDSFDTVQLVVCERCRLRWYAVSQKHYSDFQLVSGRFEPEETEGA